MRFLFSLLLLTIPASASIIPAARTVPWTPGITIGVPGGIPNRTTVYTTLPTSASATDINAALTACPANQVVMLSEGEYNLTASITFPTTKQNITLRGAGMGRTIIKATIASGFGIIVSTGQSMSAMDKVINSGYTKGSSTINVASTTGLAVGRMIVMSENNPPWTWEAGYAGLTNSVIRQRAIITGISGNDVSFTPPLVWTLEAGLNPVYKYENATGPRGIGIEDLTIEKVGGTLVANLYIASQSGGWLKNVQSTQAAGISAYILSSMFMEVRGCHIHGTTSTTDGYAIQLDPECSGVWIEDNILGDFRSNLIFKQTVGTVLSYNYCGTVNLPAAFQSEGIVINHWPHNMMNLIEGNKAQNIQDDGYHGGSSHMTLFRNHLHGLHPYQTANRKTVDFCRFGYYHNVIGNVLGDLSWRSTALYEMDVQQGYTPPVIYRLGFPNIGNNVLIGGADPEDGGFDSEVENTIIRHGNWDWQTQSTVWEADDSRGTGVDFADRVIPDSLVYSSIPSWWPGGLAWPPIGPDRQPKEGMLPAEQRLHSGQVHRAKTRARRVSTF